MRDQDEAWIFRRKLQNLKRVLKNIKEEGIIHDGTYRDYMVLISNAQMADQLDEIAKDLFEIREPMRHSVSLT